MPLPRVKVVACSHCKRLFKTVSESNLCPVCKAEEDRTFRSVRDYMTTHRTADVDRVAQACGITSQRILAWVREERLCFSEESKVVVPCMNCGIKIRMGKYCNDCKKKIASNLKSAYVIETPDDEGVRQTERTMNRMNQQNTDIKGKDMKIEFQPMDETYGALSLALYNHYILTSTATFSIKPLDREEMDRILFSGHERFPSYAILYEGAYAGYVLLNRYKPREAYDGTAEVTVYLDEKYQGKGIGSAAMTFIEDVASNYGFRALLGVVCAENKDSIKLFKKFEYFKCAHFKEVGKKFDRILDVVIYEKLI